MSTLDEPLELARLIPSDELEELIASIERALATSITIYDKTGLRLAGQPATNAPCKTVMHDGEALCEVAAMGPNPDAALDLASTSLDLLAHHAHARALAAASHEEAMRLTFAELTEHNLRLQRAVVRLEELDRLKSNFLATMSHELRTPLTSVIGYAEMMDEDLAGPVSGEQREYLTTILGKADQLLSLITAVLDVSSLESGQLALERSALSLADLVASEVATFAPQAGRRGIAIQLDAKGESIVVGDRRKIRQVVSSLLSNAVKFTPEGGRVVLKAEADADALVLTVSDTGVGIAPEDQELVFEKFRQAGNPLTREHAGTGLGLSIVRELCKLLGGEILLESELGKGSTFTVRLPWTRIDQPKLDGALAIPDDVEAKSPSGDFPRVEASATT